MQESLSIKGTREGLTITLGVGELEGMLEELGRHLEMQGSFFRGGAVALKVADRAMNTEDLRRVLDLLRAHDMILRTVVTTNHDTGDAAREMGLRLLSTGAQDEDEASDSIRAPRPSLRGNTLEGTRGILIRHVVRSGQVVRHTGHITVLGDVNAGGEIIAGGDIIVWGRLLGTAHAGALGDESASICALDMSPLQLRIAEQIARPIEDEGDGDTSPEVAHVREGRIVVEPWHRARGRAR
jgi:septum site-determining protein MinC